MTDRSVHLGPYQIALGTGDVSRAGDAIELGELERRLLVALAERAPEVVDRDTLTGLLWPNGLPPSSRALDQVLSRLRKRLGREASGALHTIRGRGLALRATTAPRPATRPGVGLPTASTPFVGFKDEIDTIERWLAERRAGWLTVTGVGGAGKSRLASEAARQLAAAGETPVWVDLAPLRDGAGPILRVARALGLDVPAGPSLDASLSGALADREVLLFLDNLEHLPAASRRLGAALTPCGAVRVVATSRRRLRVRGERLLQLRGLDPAAEAPALFIQLVRQRWIAPTESAALLDPALIGAVCAATRGHPLSIELAVATLRRRPPAALLAMLRDAPTALHGERSGREPRHASFEATFAYSWSLLDGAAQRALAAASLFTGRFDRDDARALLDLDGEVLDRLVEHSLAAELAEDGLSLHPLIRAAGRARLQDVDVDGALRTRFRARLLGWLADRCAAIRAESDPSLSARIEARMPDLGAAWHDAVAQQDVALLATAWPAARAWITYRDDYTVGADWCAAALELELPVDLRIDLLATLGHCLVPLGDGARAVERLTEAADIATDEPAPSIRLQLALAGAHARSGAYAAADDALARAHQATEAAGEAIDDDLRAWLHLSHGQRYRAAGESHLAQPHGVEALRTARASGNRPLLRRALLLHGSYLVSSSRFAEARDLAAEAQVLADAAGDQHGQYEALNIGALALRYLGDLDASLERFERARDVLVDRGVTQNLPYIRNQQANLLMELGRLDEATQVAEEALRLARGAAATKDISFTLLTLANIHLTAGRYADGGALLRERRDFEHRRGDRNVSSACITGLSLTLAAYLAGDDACAVDELEQVRALYPGDPPYIALHLALTNALVAARVGDTDRAAEAGVEALRLSRSAGAASTRRALYALCLVLLDLGQTAAVAAAWPGVDSGPPLSERWAYGPRIRAAITGAVATGPVATGLDDAAGRVERSLRDLRSRAGAGTVALDTRAEQPER